MKTEKLKQNVKGYVHQFEDGGLRLLRKGQKGVIHAIFSRFGLVLILLLLQVGLLFSIFRWFGNLWPHYFGGSVVVTSAMVIYLLNSKMDNSAKITWMVVVAIAPVVGIPMFFYVKSNFGHNILRKRLLELEDQLRGWLPQSQKAVEQLKALVECLIERFVTVDQFFQFFDDLEFGLVVGFFFSVQPGDELIAFLAVFGE